MTEKRFSIIEFSMGLLFGLAAGAIVGLLIAPRSGSEMRGKIANRATDIKSVAADLVDQARHGIGAAASQVEKIIGLQERSVRRRLDELKSQLDAYHLNEA